MAFGLIQRIAIPTLVGLSILSCTALVAAEDPINLPGLLIEKPTSIDLDFWKVTLPVNEQGHASGTGDAVELEELAGVSVPPFYDVQPDSITFTAPTNGARTGGSNYPRSELREMDGKGNRYEWLASDGGYLAATLRVNELPVPIDEDAIGRIVIGQIHGPDDELCRLYYDAEGRVYFVDDKAGEKQEETTFQLVATNGSEAKIPLGAEFSYEIAADAEKLTVTVTYEGIEYTGIDILSSFWADKPLYFKAGVYSQVGLIGSQAHTTGTGQGQATFFSISKPTHDLLRSAGELTSTDGDDEESKDQSPGDPKATDSDIYAGCTVVVLAQQIKEGVPYQAAKEKAFKMCESVQEDFSARERSTITDVVDSFFLNESGQ